MIVNVMKIYEFKKRLFFLFEFNSMRIATIIKKKYPINVEAMIKSKLEDGR